MASRLGRGAGVNVIFDLGDVLIRWNLHAGFAAEFPDPAMLRAYLDRIGFDDWNRTHDGGRPWAEGVAALRARWGPDAEPAALYPDRHHLTIAQPIEGSWALVARLDRAGHPLYALTNWSAESFPQALALHPRLAIFRDIVVSGREGMLKPDPRIYRLLLDRHGLTAGDCLFIDDSAANVAGARAVGMDAVRFTDPPALERDLTARGLI